MPPLPAWLKTYLRAFSAVVLGAFLLDGADVFAVELDELRAWAAMGVAAVLPVAIKALDPTETDFGRGSR